MADAYDLILRLTSETLSEQDRYRILRDFAHLLGWRPSYYLVDPPFTGPSANAHLVVEHGLQPSAVVTFLNENKRAADLVLEEQYRLLSISYNNLVDWHIYVEPSQVSFCFNRSKPLHTEARRISRANYDDLRNEAFDQIIGRKPNPNLPSLDGALISTISRWKRILAAELGDTVLNQDLSGLFNAILFARTIEDYNRRKNPTTDEAIWQEWNKIKQHPKTIRRALHNTLVRFTSNRSIPSDLFNEKQLIVFDELDPTTVYNLLHDFYHNRFAPYSYDFSVMSQHALSRIYERYTALLYVEESSQMSFFPNLPEEDWNKRYGSIYTPQFIARFFARFLRENTTPKLFRQMKVVDPACGSGIFLRTLLEFQCDPLHDGITSDIIRQAFQNVEGWDIDKNATHATRLSLASLYLILTSFLPEQINTLTVESIEYYQKKPELKGIFDAVIVNPPFVAIETQSDMLRERILSFMGTEIKGRIDTYLAFLRLGIELLKPGGYGFFVLPHSFLLARTGLTIRRLLTEESWIHCVVDLSAIRVFGNLGSYIILLIFQKKLDISTPSPIATVIKCQDFVGHALEDYLEGIQSDTPFYNIYEVEQDEFKEEAWILLPPIESRVRKKLRSMVSLEDIMEIREGLITGADPVFIIDESIVPDGEDALFVPFLPDRQIDRYSIREKTGQFVFYPFIEGRKLVEKELRNRFPQTWKYLCLHKADLKKRSPVIKGELEWWAPTRPRSPETLLRPKIVSPHLVIVPRFSLDLKGKYAVSHGPYMYPKAPGTEGDILRFLLGILNSPICYWYVSTHSHKVSRGYTMLEPKTLKAVPVPDPAQIGSVVMDRLLSLVQKRVEDPKLVMVEKEIERTVADLYGLSAEERTVLGVE